MTPEGASRAAVAGHSGPERRAGGTPRARLSVFAQMVWAPAAVLALGILAGSLPGYVRFASQSDAQGEFAGRVVGAPAWLLHVLNLAGALASFVSALVCLALAWLLFWRKRDDRMALFVSFYLLAFGAVLAGPLEMLDTLIPGASAVATDILQPVLFTSPTIALFALFPNGRFVPLWTRWLVLLSLVATPFVIYASLGNWTNLIELSPAAVLLGVMISAAVYAQIYRYLRVSGQTERQQTKWSVSGLVLWILVTGVATVPYFLLQNWPATAALPWWIPALSPLWWLSLDIVPVTLTVAVLRSRLFDIDAVIRRTLVYGMLTAILAAIYFATVLGAQRVAQAATGQSGQQPIFIVASTLLVASLFNPLRRQLQAAIDRRFYRRKYDAARTLERFAASMRSEVDLSQLSRSLLNAVDETLRPAHISLWLHPQRQPHDERESAHPGA
jgi:hypothetical protein